MATRKTAKKAPAKKAKRPPAKPSARAQGKTIDGYVSGLSGWQRDVAARIDAAVRSAAPRAVASIKWGQPVYEQGGPFAWMKRFGAYVSLGFWRGAELPDPRSLLEGEGNRMRHIKFRAPEALDEAVVREYVHRAVELNEAKGDPTKARKR